MSDKSSCKKDPNQPICAKQNPYNVYFDNYLKTNAATECTGLGYCMPTTREEWDAYRKVFDFLPVPFQDSEDIKDS